MRRAASSQINTNKYLRSSALYCATVSVPVSASEYFINKEDIEI